MNANLNLSRGAVATCSATSKPDVLGTLANCFADAYGLDRTTVLEGLEERERLGSTGFGRRVAIPHARIDGLERPVVALIKLETPVEFNAADGMPVDLVIGLLSPPNAGADHLHTLAAISRMIRNEAIYDALLRAEDADALFATLTNLADSVIANDNPGGVTRESA